MSTHFFCDLHNNLDVQCHAIREDEQFEMSFFIFITLIFIILIINKRAKNTASYKQLEFNSSWLDIITFGST